VHSCLYSGFVRHRRFEPSINEFAYSLFQMYLDLAELPQLFDPFLLWSARRPALAWFRREDHLGDPAEPLDVSVRNEVEKQTGVRPDGPVRLLTNLRYFGFVMNPVSYYYCFSASTGRLRTVLAEVHNTPWGERHCYVVESPVSDSRGSAHAVWNDKNFHVSPFMNMDMRYRWMMTEPGERLAVHIENHVGRSDANVALPAGPMSASGKSQPPFDVTLSLKRQELTAANLRRALLRHPCMTASIAAGIYWQALRLWCKKVPFVPHPGQASGPAGTRSSSAVMSDSP